MEPDTKSAMRRGWILVVLTGGLGCTSLLGEFELSPVTGPLPDATDDVALASTEGGVDATLDSAVEVDAAPPEPIIPCEPSEKPDIATGVFVATDGDDTTGNGSPLLPFKTIGRGVTAAVAGAKKRVHVAQGTYAESLSFDASKQGFVVSGGWQRIADAWSRDCAPGFRGRTLIAAPSNVAVRVTNATQATALESLTVATKAACAPSESCVGVWVTGTNAVFGLRKVRVIAGGGGAGAVVNQPGQAGSTICFGQVDCSSGKVGGPGTVGKPAGAGLFTVAGFVPADGDTGARGAAGENGTVGGSGIPTTCATAGIGQCQSGGDQCIHGASPAGLSQSGLCGCGGYGGIGGVGGRGGGSSVALFVSGTGATVAMEATTLVASDGGNGSAGSQGGLGGPGTAGSVGPSKTCPQDNGPNGPVNVPTCGCVGLNNKTFNGGNAGGPGGQGGQGGPGGGGAGGSSYAIVRVGGAAAIGTDPLMQLVLGKPGAGAQGAPNGAAGETLVVP